MGTSLSYVLSLYIRSFKKGTVKGAEKEKTAVFATVSSELFDWYRLFSLSFDIAAEQPVLIKLDYLHTIRGEGCNE